MIRRVAVALLVTPLLAACDPPPPPPGPSVLAERALKAKSPEGEMLLVVERRQSGRTLVCGYWREKPGHPGAPVALEVPHGDATAWPVDPAQCQGVLPEPHYAPPIP